MSEKSKGLVRSVDVARLAGVSRSAVSRTYTPGAYVSEETRRKVLRAAEALGYSPNAMARSLITNRTGIVGIVSADLENPFYAMLLQSLTVALQKEGLASLLLFSDDLSTDRQISQILSYRVDALVTTNASLSSRVAALYASTQNPIVAINRRLPIEDITSITCDNGEAIGRVVDHLVDIGCRRIAFISGSPEVSSSRERETGFLRRMAHYGLSPSRMTVGDYTLEGGARAAREVLRVHARPEAIVCANDLMAFSVMDVARNEFGLSIPGQLKVTGFDNSSLADWASHALTSIDQNISEMVRLAIDCIVDGIAGRTRIAQHVQVPGSLIIRASTQMEKDDPLSTMQVDRKA